MSLKRALAFAACVCLAGAAPASAGEVRLTIQDGRVSLTAKDATLRQILDEWAKVGQTRIVNGERVPGGPLTVQFTNVPEEQALDSLLRPLTGYVAAPRPGAVANLSRFDRIVVMPTIAAAVVPAGPGPQPPAYAQPAMPYGQPAQPIAGVADDQEDDRPAPNPRGPVFNTFPAPQVVAPQQQPAYPTATPGAMPPTQGPLVLPQPNLAQPNVVNPYATFQTAPYPGAATAPIGTPTPGMVPQPQLPGQPGAQPQPKRPGPGGQD